MRTTSLNCCRVTRSGLLDDEVDQIAGLMLDDGPEVIVGDRGGHAGDEDVRPSSSKGNGDGYSKGDEKIAKSDLPHVSVGLPGDGITYVNDDGKGLRSTRPGDRILSGRTDSG